MPVETPDTSLPAPSTTEVIIDVGEKMEDVPPEGGLAGWLSIIGCSCGLFSTFGFLNA
jgi:hypothetical protein